MGVETISRYGSKTQLPKRLEGMDREVWPDLAMAAQKRRSVDRLNQNLDRGQEKDKKNFRIRIVRIMFCIFPSPCALRTT